MYFGDCPSWKETHQYLVEIIAEEEIGTAIELRKIETNSDATKYQFPGSPTIKVNGIDIFPTNQTDYALGCRVYKTPEGLKGSPTREMIAERIRSLI